jgi:hypothetical protein
MTRPTNGKRKQRQDFIFASVREGNRLAKDKSDQRAYAKWFATLGESDKQFARDHGLNKPMPEGGFRRKDSEDALEGAEHEPLPHGAIRGYHNDRPIIGGANAVIEAIEPESRYADIPGLTENEVLEAAEVFSVALRWGLEENGKKEDGEHHLVRTGSRAVAIIASMRPDLATGMSADKDLMRLLVAEFSDFRVGETIGKLARCGRLFGRVLEWVRRGKTISVLGENMQLLAYVVRPDLIDASTLEEIGSPSNKTRQAMDKRVNDLRDTFDGIRAMTMRPDITRIRCQHAQLA